MSTDPAVEMFDFGFAENGLTAYKLGKQLPSQSFIKHVGEEEYKKIVNFCLHYIADLDIPIKRFVSLSDSWNASLTKRWTSKWHVR